MQKNNLNKYLSSIKKFNLDSIIWCKGKCIDHSVPTINIFSFKQYMYIKKLEELKQKEVKIILFDEIIKELNKKW